MLTAGRNHRRRAAALVGLAASLAWATQPAQASPGIPAKGAPKPAAALQAAADALAAAGGIGVVAAASGPNVTWSGAAGVRSIDAGKPAQAGDTARVGSVSKSMVATLTLQEVQKGRWTLATTVDDVLPGLLPGHGTVTLEQLLSHRSGAPDYIQALVKGATTNAQLLDVLNKKRTDPELVAAANKEPWLFTPGSAFSYSNTNYLVVGMMLAKVNHKSVGQLLEQRIFRPAGMTTAAFPMARPWTRTPHLTDYAIFERPYNLDNTSPTLFSTPGGVVASAKDLDRFYRALFAGTLLRGDLVKNMATPRSTETLDYGLGIYAVGDPCPGPGGEQQALYGHDGATFGTQTLAFTSADGTRQASIAFSGRQYVEAPTTAKPANDYLIAAFSANCPRPVPPVPSAKQQSAANLLPSLESLVPADPEAVAPAR